MAVNALWNGIGRVKAFGCGVLSLSRIFEVMRFEAFIVQGLPG